MIMIIPNCSLLRILILFLCMILIQGCGPASRPDGASAGAGEQQAQTLITSGDYAGAAAEYQKLADTDKPRAGEFLLKAADAYLQADQTASAESALAQLNEKKLTAIQTAELGVLQARIALLNDDALAALNKLQTPLPPESPRPLLRAYHATHAEALQKDNQLLPAVAARVELNSYLDTPAELTDNQNLIWELLQQSDLNNLQQAISQPDHNPLFISWIELAIINKTLNYSPAELQTALTAWTQRYPDHPALTEIIPAITAATAQADTPAQQIALLLPFNTQYDDAANVIRDGFLAAWYADSGERPAVRVYTADAGNITEVYTRAVAEGADTIVGPLDKEAVAALINASVITVKTLTLNQISSADVTAGTNFNLLPLYQFALSPEDEARLAARRAWLDGHAKALVITQDNTWGDRIYSAFSSEWTTLGGQLIEHVKIPANVEDFSSPIKDLLNVDKSERRAKELTATLRRNIIAEPRHRQDGDIIFLATTPVIAQQIVPQLRFYRADDISTYSISSIYSGQYEPEINSDLDNVIFADMPWLLDPVLENSPLQLALNNAWGQDTSAYRRLYAFGVDAYRILPELGRLRSQTGNFQGVTGDLSLDGQGYVQRQPLWARFVDGTPRLLTGFPATQQ